MLLKRVPKFGFLLGYSYIFGDGEPGFAAATAASIGSAPFINPVRMIEKHTLIHDIFSGEQLDTRTQLALLKVRAKVRQEELLSKQEDLDAAEYQHARKASQFKAER